MKSVSDGLLSQAGTSQSFSSLFKYPSLLSPPEQKIQNLLAKLAQQIVETQKNIVWDIKILDIIRSLLEDEALPRLKEMLASEKINVERAKEELELYTVFQDLIQSFTQAIIKQQNCLMNDLMHQRVPASFRARTPSLSPLPSPISNMDLKDFEEALKKCVSTVREGDFKTEIESLKKRLSKSFWLSKHFQETLEEVCKILNPMVNEKVFLSNTLLLSLLHLSHERAQNIFSPFQSQNTSDLPGEDKEIQMEREGLERKLKQAIQSLTNAENELKKHKELKSSEQNLSFREIRTHLERLGYKRDDEKAEVCQVLDKIKAGEVQGLKIDVDDSGGVDLLASAVRVGDPILIDYFLERRFNPLHFPPSKHDPNKHAKEQSALSLAFHLKGREDILEKLLKHIKDHVWEVFLDHLNETVVKKGERELQEWVDVCWKLLSTLTDQGMQYASYSNGSWLSQLLSGFLFESSVLEDALIELYEAAYKEANGLNPEGLHLKIVKVLREVSSYGLLSLSLKWALEFHMTKLESDEELREGLRQARIKYAVPHLSQEIETLKKHLLSMSNREEDLKKQVEEELEQKFEKKLEAQKEAVAGEMMLFQMKVQEELREERKRVAEEKAKRQIQKAKLQMQMEKEGKKVEEGDGQSLQSLLAHQVIDKELDIQAPRPLFLQKKSVSSRPDQ